MPTRLHPLRSPDDAVPVPWRVDRRDPRHPRVILAGGEPAEHVRVFAQVAGTPRDDRWGTMAPGDAATVCLCDVDPDDAVVTIAWFRPSDGREYVWRFVL